MAILGVGIYPVKTTKVTVNSSDQGKSLDITFKAVTEGTTKAKEDDALSFLNSSSVEDSNAGKENNVRLYGVNKTGYDGNEKDGDTLLSEVFQRRDQFNHILAAYKPSSEVKWNLAEGLNVKSKEELVKAITKEATLNKMVDNLFTQFEEQMAPVIGEDSETVLVKFLRKSKASNFPRLADKKLDWNPFIANMKDEKLKAKVKFSKWEEEQGFNSNEQSLEGADGQNADELASQTQAVNSVLDINQIHYLLLGSD